MYNDPLNPTRGRPERALPMRSAWARAATTPCRATSMAASRSASTRNARRPAEAEHPHRPARLQPHLPVLVRVRVRGWACRPSRGGRTAVGHAAMGHSAQGGRHLAKHVQLPLRSTFRAFEVPRSTATNPRCRSGARPRDLDPASAGDRPAGARRRQRLFGAVRSAPRSRPSARSASTPACAATRKC